MEVAMQDAGGSSLPQLRCIASAKGKNTPFGVSLHRHDISTVNETTSFLRDIHFTPDGSSVIAQSDDHKLHTFILPTDLYEVDKQPHELQPYASKSSPDTLLSFAVWPGYDLSDTNTTFVLSGETEQPIKLRNAIDYDTTACSYPWVHTRNERIQKPHSLAFFDAGAKFAAGTRDRIAIFDVNRSGEGPIKDKVLHTQTGTADGSLAMALAPSTDRILAIGTTSRKVALWSNTGTGREILAFTLTPPRGVRDVCEGVGITSLAWSPGEQYLLVAERRSDCIQVFDVRNVGHRLSWLGGRNAMSPQPLGFEVIPSATGTEVWAGGSDGKLRLWTQPGTHDGEHLPDFETSLSGAPITSVAWHPENAVLATGSGTRLHNPPADSDSSSNSSIELGMSGINISRSSSDSSSNSSSDQESEILDEEVNTLGLWTWT